MVESFKFTGKLNPNEFDKYVIITIRNKNYGNRKRIVNQKKKIGPTVSNREWTRGNTHHDNSEKQSPHLNRLTNTAKRPTLSHSSYTQQTINRCRNPT